MAKAKLKPLKHLREPPRRLQVGEIVYCDSRRYVVVRVNDCAATLKEYRPPTIEVVGGREYEFPSDPVGEPAYVSAYAFMDRAEPGEETF